MKTTIALRLFLAFVSITTVFSGLDANATGLTKTVVIQTLNSESMFEGQFQLVADSVGNITILECPPAGECEKVAQLDREELRLIAKYITDDAGLFRNFKKGTRFILASAAVVGGIAIPFAPFAALAVAVGAGGSCAINTGKSAAAKCGEALAHALRKADATFPSHIQFVEADVDFKEFKKVLLNNLN